MARFREFKENKSPELYRYYFSLDGAFQSKLRRKYAGKVGLKELNKDLNTDYSQWKDIHLSRTKPEGPPGQLWEKFVRKDLNLQFIHVNEQAQQDYQKLLKKNYRQNIGWFNRSYGTNIVVLMRFSRQ
ncbi:unnamed protein product [marine sediment metagenome]|uniref:Uncharacterized protein n=1 Tax=marine sediment metagenome TaxID=412755 RepID=X1TK49_9ZZZZ